jgi:hypothetical protein
LSQTSFSNIHDAVKLIDKNRQFILSDIYRKKYRDDFLSPSFLIKFFSAKKKKSPISDKDMGAKSRLRRFGYSWQVAPQQSPRPRHQTRLF